MLFVGTILNWLMKRLLKDNDNFLLDLFIIFIPSYLLALHAIVASDKETGFYVTSEFFIIKKKSKKEKKHASGEEERFKWSEISAIKKKILFVGWVKLINNVSGKVIYSFPYGWFTSESLKGLTQKYVPSNHEFYKIINST